MQVKIYVAGSSHHNNDLQVITDVLICVGKSFFRNNCEESAGWITGDLAHATDADLVKLKNAGITIEKVEVIEAETAS